jgi:SAM-dependent methyltransferase
MDAALLALLRCPRCGSPLEERPDGVGCASGHPISTRDGYVDLWSGTDDPDVQRTVESFGFEWNTFDAVNEEDEGYWRWYFEDVPAASLEGATALDAGCGKGRYTQLTASRVARLVALDASLAVEAAARNLAALDNVVVVRGDLRTPPVATEAFDFVSCLGVLHHLPDPRAGFDALVRLLRPGGTVLVYVYSRPERAGVRRAGLAAAAALRRVTVRLPHRVLRALSLPIAAILQVAFVLPGALGDRRRVRALSRLPLQAYRRRPVRSLWLDTFDRLSAPLEVRYVWSEIEPWFLDAGLEVVAVRDDAGLFVVARRP